MSATDFGRIHLKNNTWGIRIVSQEQVSGSDTDLPQDPPQESGGEPDLLQSPPQKFGGDPDLLQSPPQESGSDSIPTQPKELRGNPPQELGSHSSPSQEQPHSENDINPPQQEAAIKTDLAVRVASSDIIHTGAEVTLKLTLEHSAALDIPEPALGLAAGDSATTATTETDGNGSSMGTNKKPETRVNARNDNSYGRHHPEGAGHGQDLDREDPDRDRHRESRRQHKTSQYRFSSEDQYGSEDLISFKEPAPVKLRPRDLPSSFYCPLGPECPDLLRGIDTKRSHQHVRGQVEYLSFNSVMSSSAGLQADQGGSYTDNRESKRQTRAQGSTTRNLQLEQNTGDSEPGNHGSGSSRATVAGNPERDNRGVSSRVRGNTAQESAGSVERYPERGSRASKADQDNHVVDHDTAGKSEKQNHNSEQASVREEKPERVIDRGRGYAADREQRVEQPNRPARADHLEKGLKHQEDTEETKGRRTKQSSTNNSHFESDSKHPEQRSRLSERGSRSKERGEEVSSDSEEEAPQARPADSNKQSGATRPRSYAGVVAEGTGGSLPTPGDRPQPGRVARAIAGITSSLGNTIYRDDSEVHSLKKQNLQLVRNHNKISQEKANIEVELQRFKQNWGSFERHYKGENFDLKAKIERLTEDLARERSEKINHQNRVEKIAGQLDNKELFIGAQLSDSNIAASWNSLWAQVKSWSSAFSCEEPVDRKALEEEHPDWIELLRGLAKGDPGLVGLDKKRTRREYAQALVGFCLGRVVFRRLYDLPAGAGDSSASNGNRTVISTAQDLWTSNTLAAPIDTIEQALYTAASGSGPITDRQFHDWRAFTISLVSRAVSDPQQYAFASATQIALNWTELIVTCVPPKPATREKLENGLILIIQKAIDLSLELRKQRAYWTIEGFYSGRSEFNKDTMEDIDDPDEEDMDEDAMQVSRVVSVFIFPALFKRGNADGELYDQKICLVRGKVKCMLQK